MDLRNAALAAEGLDNHTHNARLSKSARAYAKTYKPGPPLVPNIIVERILTYIGKVVIRKKNEFVWMMCRYWSLKREARRGAPLLKRLHLEPWTAASSAGKAQSEEEKTMKLEVRLFSSNSVYWLALIEHLIPAIETPSRRFDARTLPSRFDTQARNSQKGSIRGATGFADKRAFLP